jgi:pimeloyl-ACP methyl ester carboxylesterase
MAELGELSVRQDKPVYGKVARQVELVGGVGPAGCRTAVLLIHGYANSQKTASGSYDNCIANLENLASNAGSRLISPVFKFYWPGDVDIPIISQLSYPWQIAQAVDSGSRLADFLKGLAGPNGTPVEIHLVSHSLGGRVVLEAIKRCMDAPSVLLRSMSMMACAVPVHMVENTHELLFPALQPRQRQVLFSAADVVLMIFFRLGEMAAGEGFLPQAVGSLGQPNGIWLQQNMKGLQHGDYWPSPQAAATLAGFLKLPIAPLAPPNAISSRPGPEERTTAPPRDLSVRSAPGKG